MKLTVDAGVPRLELSPSEYGFLFTALLDRVCSMDPSSLRLRLGFDRDEVRQFVDALSQAEFTARQAGQHWLKPLAATEAPEEVKVRGAVTQFTSKGATLALSPRLYSMVVTAVDDRLYSLPESEIKVRLGLAFPDAEALLNAMKANEEVIRAVTR